MEDKDRANGGRKLEVLVLVRVPQSQTHKRPQARFVHRHCFGSLAMWFTSALSRCPGKTFTYKVKDREIVLSCLFLLSIFFKTIYILKYLAHSINRQMESLHIEPVWGRDQLYQRLCCGWQSPSLHRRSIAHLREGFRSRPCTVTRLQCGRFMAIPFRERTRKLSMRVCWLKEHYLRQFAASVCQF